MRSFLVVASALAACYDGPRLRCEVGCDFANNGACPRGLECGPDNLCRTTGGSTCTPTDDADVDAPLFECFGMQVFPFTQICTDPGFQIQRNRVLATALDTDLHCDFVRDSRCVIAGHPITIDGKVRVTGSLPLALIGDSIIVKDSATLDLAGRRQDVLDGMPAPANAQPCAGGAGMGPNNATDGGGGGAGGSHRSRGGAGGVGFNTLGGTATGAQLVGLQGGCRGGNGGLAGSSNRGLGGHSGGAVYLLGRNGITIDGVINASGGGATAPSSRSGGGGGGSGGVIMMWSAGAITVKATARVLAVGGGGSSGAPAAGDGTAGNDVDPTTGVAVAAPIPGGPGIGGGGGIDPTNDAPSGTGAQASQQGGGGGGGGVGHIFIEASPLVDPGARIRPPPN